MEVTRDSTSLADPGARGASTTCFSLSTCQHRFSLQKRLTTSPTRSFNCYVASAAYSQSRHAPRRPVPFRLGTLFPTGPGAPLHAGSCGLLGGGAAASQPRVAGSGRGLRTFPGPAPRSAAPRRAAPLIPVLVLTCLSAEVLHLGAGTAAGSVASRGAEQSLSGTRSRSSRRHGE